MQERRWDKRPALEVVSQNIDFTADGGVGTIVVKSFFPVTATSSTQSDPDNDWCTVSVSCKTITVTATENVGITTRTAEIKITTAAGTTLTVEAHQEATPFKLEKTTVNLTWKGEFSEQNILCFSQDPLLIDDSGIASWLKYELKDDFLHFKADPNTAGYGRKSTLKLTRTNGEVETITINQAGQLVKFADLIGAYTLTYIDGDDEPRSVQVTFAQLVANTSYRVGSFVVPGPTTTTSYNITFTFDAVNNRINYGGRSKFRCLVYISGLDGFNQLGGRLYYQYHSDSGKLLG